MKKLFIFSFVFMFAAGAGFYVPVTASAASNTASVATIASIQKEINSIAKQIQSLFNKISSNTSKKTANVVVKINSSTASVAQISATAQPAAVVLSQVTTQAPDQAPTAQTQPAVAPTLVLKVMSPNVYQAFEIGMPSKITWSANANSVTNNVDIYLLKDTPRPSDECPTDSSRCVSVPTFSTETWTIAKGMKNISGANSYDWMLGKIAIPTISYGIAHIFVDPGLYRIQVCPAGSKVNCDESDTQFRLEREVPEVQVPVRGDINGDGAANLADIAMVINSWGPCPESSALALAACPADLDGDSVVGDSDIAIIRANWSY